MTRNVFNPEMLILARETRGHNQSALASLVSIQQGTVSKIESGLLVPSEDLISKLADRLEFPSDFFFQTDRVFGFNSTVFFHRKRQSMPDRILRKLHAQMNLTRMRIGRLSRSLNVVVQSGFQSMDPEEYEGGVTAVARLVRQMWMLPSGPVRNLVEAIENAGGIVIDFDFGTKQADAISEWVPGFPPIFLVNSNSDIPWDRRRLTLAHELGHIIMHRLPNPKMEDQANEFASEFLMPRREIKPSLYALTMAKLADLKRYWKVSMQALIERAFQLKTITEYQRRNFYINLNRKGSRVHEPLEHEYSPERPTSLFKMALAHIESLGYSVRELGALLFFRDEADFRSEILGERALRLVVA
jgi:Zn-dependent peptidase ImmA (M78 family)/transcriptional regulator with XRE-family HTH domain